MAKTTNRAMIRVDSGTRSMGLLTGAGLMAVWGTEVMLVWPAAGSAERRAGLRRSPDPLPQDSEQLLSSLPDLGHAS